MEKLKIFFYGGGREVGGSCIGVKYPDGTLILLDAGVKLASNAPVQLPVIKNAEKVSAVMISHPHIDHFGGLVSLVRDGLNCPIIVGHELARQVCKVLFSDMCSLEKRQMNKINEQPRFVMGNAYFALSLMKESLSGKIGGVSYRFIKTSHIPGGYSILLEYPGAKTILYSGDVRLSKTQLLEETKVFPEADVLFTDCTYAGDVHPDRGDTEKEFKRIVLETMRKCGKVVVTCFSVARTQEILLVLAKIGEKINAPIYLDGMMGKEITKIYLRYAETLDNKNLLKATKNVIPIEEHCERMEALDKSGIIVTGGGMVNSPLAQFYVQSISQDRNSAVILPGFVAEETGGYEIKTKGTLTIDDHTFRLKCAVHQLNFSAHADSKEIKELIKIVDPEVVIAMHGEERGINGAMNIAKGLGKKAIAAKNGKFIMI